MLKIPQTLQIPISHQAHQIKQIPLILLYKTESLKRNINILKRKTTPTTIKSTIKKIKNMILIDNTHRIVLKKVIMNNLIRDL
jgi:hypothetical protein